MKLKNKIISVAWEMNRILLSRSKGDSVVTVCEYPKGGGTWIAKMCATSLGLPYIGNGLFVPLVPCVIRTHWSPDARITPCIIVVRDVRDVMVSLFHHRVRNIENTPRRATQYADKLGEALNVDSIVSQLPGFMEIEFKDPRYGSHQNWVEYINKSIAISSSTGKGVVLVRYEDVLSKPIDTLYDAMTSIGKNALVDHVKIATELHSAKWGNVQSNNLNESTFLRSATSGGWKACFSSESAAFIAENCGEQLIKLQYEDDKNWWKSI